jgi:hypothetical protein
MQDISTSEGLRTYVTRQATKGDKYDHADQHVELLSQLYQGKVEGENIEKIVDILDKEVKNYTNNTPEFIKTYHSLIDEAERRAYEAAARKEYEQLKAYDGHGNGKANDMENKMGEYISHTQRNDLGFLDPKGFSGATKEEIKDKIAHTVSEAHLREAKYQIGHFSSIIKGITDGAAFEEAIGKIRANMEAAHLPQEQGEKMNQALNGKIEMAGGDFSVRSGRAR